MIPSQLDVNDHVRQIKLYETQQPLIIDARIPFTIRSDVRTHRFNFRAFCTSASWQKSVLTVLIDLLETHSPSYAQSCQVWARRLTAMMDRRGDGLLRAPTIADVEAWPTTFGLWSWPFILAVFKRWKEQGLPGLDPEIAEFVDQPTKWEEKGNGAFFALVTNDPERGALTNQELKNVQQALDQAFSAGLINRADWTLWWFLIGTGARPVQMARMRRKDVIISHGPEGKEVTLMIPLAKGREADKSQRWKMKCPTVLAEALLLWLKTDLNALKKPNDILFHESGQKISYRLGHAAKNFITASDRLDGAPIPLTPYRLRYTLGTRAIAFGATDDEVARLLTHRTKTSVAFYRASMPELQRPLMSAIGEEMWFIARAFKGRLINDLSEATRANDARALITDFANLFGQGDAVDVGACGTMAKCHQDAPRACLECFKFEPFFNAPWEALLAELERDAEMETERRIKSITEGMIQAVKDIISERDLARIEAAA